MICTPSKLTWLLTALLMAAAVAQASQPLNIPEGIPVSTMPMAIIEGRGTVPFQITFGMLVTSDGTPVGLYRSYPSKMPVPLIEEYGLGMLGTRDGVILSSYGTLPLLILHGHIGDHPGTCALSVTYLTEYKPRRYATCTLRVAHTPQGQWETVDSSGRPITTFIVLSHRYGITRIDHCGA